MNQVERDDFSNALGQTLKFFGKDLERAILASGTQHLVIAM